MSLILTSLTDGVLTITLNEPARRNPLSQAMRDDIVGALTPVPADLRAVILTGADGAFSAGGDLASMPPQDRESSVERMNGVGDFMRFFVDLPIVTIAAVEGAAAGASVGLVCACDFVVAGRGARFLLPFARLGIVPDGGLLSLLPARVGLARARRLFLDSRPIDAEDGASFGLVDELVDSGQALTAAQALATRLAQRAPGSVAHTKRALAGGVPSLESALQAENDGQAELFFTEDSREGKQAFFDKRSPQFTGR